MTIDPIWQSLLLQARNGSMLHPPIGELGSANWQIGDPIPKTLLLCDLSDETLCLLQNSRNNNNSDTDNENHTNAILPPFPEEFSTVEELDLSGNALHTLPNNIHVLKNLRRLFLGGYPLSNPQRKNHIQQLPNLSSLSHLEHLSVHDTNLCALPELPLSLQVLRVDLCPLNAIDLQEKGMRQTLPPNLNILHLEGCPLPGTLEHPDLLPDAVKKLKYLEDLQLPDGCHIGSFFGMPLDVAISQAQEKNEKE